MKKVIMYSTLSCSYCKMAKEFFNENNIQFEEKDIGSDPQALQEMLTKTKILMPPIFDIDGTIVVGYDKNKLKNLLGINK